MKRLNVFIHFSVLHKKLKLVSQEKIIIIESISLIIKKFSFLEIMGFKNLMT